jgi:hypothetical protein
MTTELVSCFGGLGMLNAYLGSWIPMVIWVCFMLLHLIRVLYSYPSLRHFFTDTRIQLAHLGSLSDLVPLTFEPIGGLNSSSSS